MTEKDFEQMRKTEARVIETARKRAIEKPPIEDIMELYTGVEYSTQDGNKRWNDSVAQKYREIAENTAIYLDGKISHTGAITDEQQIEELTNGKIPIMISGASKKAWPKIAIEDQENIALAMQVLVDVLDPTEAYIVTGGTNFGAERTMHEAVHRRNLKSETPLALLGTFTMEAALDGEKGVDKDTITHAMVLKTSNGRRAKDWMELPDTQLEYVLDRNGCMIALGGGAIVSDMIQRAYNLDVEMHLMDGPQGASTDKCKSLRGNDYSFKSPEELVRRIYDKHPNIFIPEFSLDKIYEYVQQAKGEILGERIVEQSVDISIDEIRAIDETVTDAERNQAEQKLIQEAKASQRNQMDRTTKDDRGSR